VRIEDLDQSRCVEGADAAIIDQLAALGLVADEPPAWQSQRDHLYQRAMARLVGSGWAFPCGCTRSEIAAVWQQRGASRERHGDLVYPGTCREGLFGKPARAMRLLVAPSNEASNSSLSIGWHDRRLGAQHQDVTRAVGDFVLKRADGPIAYQLAVVVDDAAQGITHVVRGEDLADNTARQIHLQHLLGLPTPIYMHTALVMGPNGEKLSKQNGARAVDMGDPMGALRAAGTVLELDAKDGDVQSWLATATAQWRSRWVA
jgi:glutamyl-Q tRNA(Asp) synthetase